VVVGLAPAGSSVIWGGSRACGAGVGCAASLHPFPLSFSLSLLSSCCSSACAVVVCDGAMLASSAAGLVAE
jgi:hypothetical protein